MSSRKGRFLLDFLKVDKELVIIFLLVSITAIIFFFVSNQRAFLNFFYLPALLGAYYYGKRYATLSALLSIILIFIVAYVYPQTFEFGKENELNRWLDILTWGGFLMVTGYSMGHLYEKKEAAAQEIRSTYRGIVEMLSLLIDAVDQQTQSHSYRVSVVSVLLSENMGLPVEDVENIRVAALLHDLGKIGINREILAKVGQLSASERAQVRSHANYAVDVLGPVGGKVVDLLPLILSHHEKYDGSGYIGVLGSNIPLGARIIAVADVYDALISDRPYRKALTPLLAKNEIVTNSGVQFDPNVVRAFERIFAKIETESHLSHLKLGI
jgi:HD-GYP domain-containing protein (c-di-GMP phosphodiesterase class II)